MNNINLTKPCSKLINAKQMHQENPERFDWEDFSGEIKIGNYLKICNGKERFWVSVCKIIEDKNLYVGEIDFIIKNDLGSSFVVFSAENVYQRYG